MELGAAMTSPELPAPVTMDANRSLGGFGQVFFSAVFESMSSPAARHSRSAPELHRSLSPHLVLSPAKGSSAVKADEDSLETGTLHLESEQEDEGKSVMGWNLLRSGLRMVNVVSSAMHGKNQDTLEEELKASQKSMQERENQHFAKLTECMEQGFSRETTTDFTTPLRRVSRLWRFRLLRSQDNTCASLVTEEGDFLLHARLIPEFRKVEFHLYPPGFLRKRDELLSAPAFIMCYSKCTTKWRLVQERCRHCQLAPVHLSCAEYGKQQLAFIQHLKRPTADGLANVMKLRIPGIYKDGSCVTWCPMLGKLDLADLQDDDPDSQQLVSRSPDWNDKDKSLVLQFKGRNVVSSAKNFQFALPQKPQSVICQFGKLELNTFSLDVRYPLSIVQAFALAMSTSFWT
eukprot:TRINITY_DN75699_c0_g1_i1.p1 TRINITY_DN75699_c0_g1~~TRINITY_DN75699_c0_g1_i1.p1  ORF type:complete len:403 (+),score=59.90 TRINITY_DN75699_c0_g1_i1:52-1260(+)